MKTYVVSIVLSKHETGSTYLQLWLGTISADNGDEALGMAIANVKKKFPDHDISLYLCKEIDMETFKLGENK